MAEIEQADLTTLTVELLSAFVSNNTIDSGDLAGLIQSTHTALAGNQRAHACRATRPRIRTCRDRAQEPRVAGPYPEPHRRKAVQDAQAPSQRSRADARGISRALQAAG